MEPWLLVTASIDGNHLAVVVWQGRVHLFWVIFLPQAEPQEQTSTTPAGDVGLNELSGCAPPVRASSRCRRSCST